MVLHVPGPEGGLIVRLLLVGDPRTGKTAFMKRHRTGEFVNTYIPTSNGWNVGPYCLEFFTNRGRIQFDCYEININYFGRRMQGYLARRSADCAIIMFDVTEQWTYTSVPRWHAMLRSFYSPSISRIVLCGNKVDVENRQVMMEQVTENLQYYEISARSNYNLEKPFLYLARILTGDLNLHFVAAPALPPPEVHVDLAAQQQHEAEVAAAAAQPLPDDDDDAFE